jgi:hypothetical protein
MDLRVTNPFNKHDTKRASMDVRVVIRTNPPAAGEPMVRCAVCERQRYLAGFARVVITMAPNEVAANETAQREHTEDLFLCTTCLAQPNVVMAVARSFHPEDVEIISLGGEDVARSIN